MRPVQGQVLSLFVDLRSADLHEVLAEAGLEHLRADVSVPDGTQGLAIFSCPLAGLLEVLRLPRPVPTRMILADVPVLTPIADLGRREAWLVALVGPEGGRLFLGSPDGLAEQRREPRASMARRVDAEVRRHGVDRVLIGGPGDLQDFVERLGDQARGGIAGCFDADVEAITSDEVLRQAAAAAQDCRERELAAYLNRLDADLPSGGATAGAAGVRGALEQRRVEALLLARDYEPGDEDVTAAIAQDARFIRVEDERLDGHGIAAVLRF